MTKLVLCVCTHEYQDKKYGYGLRIHNYTKKNKGWRCTVCIRIVNATEQENKKHG